MFNLFRSREKSVRIVLGGVLLVVAASMLLYLVPSYNTGGAPSSENVVADVGGEEITVADVRKLIDSTLKGKQMPPEVLPNYIPRMVDEMITDRALEYQARRMGFQVTDQDLATTVRQMLPADLFPNGKFAGKEAYAMVLAQRNLSIEEFEADVRRQILIHRLIDVAIEGSIVSELEIEQTFKGRNEKIKIQYVKLLADSYKKEVEPSVEELRNYFNTHTNRYQAPGKRRLAVLYLDQAKLEESLTPSDNDLRTMYAQGQEQFRVPERVKVRHILLLTKGKPASDEPKIKAQADDILKQVKGGAKFSDLVEKYSEDPGSKANAPGREPGLEPGEYWVERNGQMVPEFETAAFALKPGQSDVIKTTYGYHVFQVVEHEQGRLKPFEEVKGDLAKQWKTQRASAIMQIASDRAEGALRADPTHPEKVAADLHMQLIRVDDYNPGQAMPEIGVNPDFDRSVENLKPGEVSQAVVLPPNKLALAELTEVTPPRQKTFDEVQAQLHDEVVQGRVANALQKHAQALYEKAREMNNDLEKAAKSMGLEVKTSEEFTRSGFVKELENTSANYFQQGFRLPEGSVFGPIPLGSGTVVAKVIAHVAADMSELPPQRSKIRDDIKSKKAEERNNLFEAGVVTELERQGKIKKHQDVIDRIISVYVVKG
jgi:peptidyl-prolyl cis-trans isomerase D